MEIRSKNKISAEGSMSSMTDLVFLLLIFFIILSTMISPGIPVDLPSGKSTAQTESTPVTVGVDAAQQHFINMEPVTVVDLEEKLKQKMQEKGEQSIVLRVDQTVPTGVTVNILDIAKRNEWKVAIATKVE